MHLQLPPVQTARVDWQGTTPWAVDYADSYFMPEQGPAESQAVFIEASDLPRRFAALPPGGLFVIGETGFGTGLNALLAADCFAHRAPPLTHLHYYSAELHPLSKADLARAVSHWPELAGTAQRLLAVWPPPAPGFHRLRLTERIELTLMFGDARALWPVGPDRVDAWFLDGFAPARNPALWDQQLLTALATRSRPGTTVATYTAAGSVRRGLAEAGFEVSRRPGFSGKRHRLTAHQPGTWTPQRTRRGQALIVGAGLAGCTTARALAERGWQSTVIDPCLTGQAPTSPLMGVLYTTASHHLNAQNRFYLTGLLHARHRLDHLGFPRHARDGRLEGVIQHLVDARIATKTRRAMATGAWPAELLSAVDDERVVFHGAGCLDPVAWCRHLLDHTAIDTRAGRVARIEDGPGIQLADGSALTADAVILCTAGATRDLPGLDWLGLRIVRGQVTFCRATDESARWTRPQCHSGYLTPAFDGVHCIGATFDRQRSEPVIDPDDDRANLAELAHNLPTAWRALGGDRAEIVGQLAGLRCQSPDTLPLVGPLPDPAPRPHGIRSGLYLNIAHGSRGLAHTPLCAEMLADQLAGHPAPVDRDIIDALAPERFIERWRRRDPDWVPGKH